MLRTLPARPFGISGRAGRFPFGTPGNSSGLKSRVSPGSEPGRPPGRHSELAQMGVERHNPAVNYLDRITIEPDKRGGKPCLRGLRITVYDVLDYLAGGMSPEEILDDFPDLEREDIQAALAFAAERERRLYSPSAA